MKRVVLGGDVVGVVTREVAMRLCTADRMTRNRGG